MKTLSLVFAENFSRYFCRISFRNISRIHHRSFREFLHTFFQQYLQKLHQKLICECLWQFLQKCLQKFLQEIIQVFNPDFSGVSLVISSYPPAVFFLVLINLSKNYSRYSLSPVWFSSTKHLTIPLKVFAIISLGFFSGTPTRFFSNFFGNSSKSSSSFFFHKLLQEILQKYCISSKKYLIRIISRNPWRILPDFFTEFLRKFQLYQGISKNDEGIPS